MIKEQWKPIVEWIQLNPRGAPVKKMEESVFGLEEGYINQHSLRLVVFVKNLGKHWGKSTFWTMFWTSINQSLVKTSRTYCNANDIIGTNQQIKSFLLLILTIKSTSKRMEAVKEELFWTSDFAVTLTLFGWIPKSTQFICWFQWSSHINPTFVLEIMRISNGWMDGWTSWKHSSGGIIFILKNLTWTSFEHPMERC